MTEENETKEKDTFFKRIARGFKILIGKISGVANNMEKSNKQETTKDTFSGIDMSYGPKL